MRTRYSILLLGLAAVLWVVVNLPASMLRFVIAPSFGTLITPVGTLWRGSSQLVTPLGIEAEAAVGYHPMASGCEFRAHRCEDLDTGKAGTIAEQHSCLFFGAAGLPDIGALTGTVRLICAWHL